MKRRHFIKTAALSGLVLPSIVLSACENRSSRSVIDLSENENTETFDLESKEYKDALKKILSVTRNGIDGMMREFKLDSICGPTNGPAWCTDLVNGDFFTGYGMYSAAAIAGYPHISIPMGLVQGLPVGLTFIGVRYGEPELISVAYAYEQASRKRVAPRFARDFSNVFSTRRCGNLNQAQA